MSWSPSDYRWCEIKLTSSKETSRNNFACGAERITKRWKPKWSRYRSCSIRSKNCATSNKSSRQLLFIGALDRALGHINGNRDRQSKTDENKIHKDRKRFRSVDKLHWMLPLERSFCRMYMFIYGRILVSFLTATQFCVHLSQMFEYQDHLKKFLPHLWRFG